MNGLVIAFVIAAQTLPKQDASELRPRLTVNATVEASPRLRFHFEGLAEALVADRARHGGRITAATGDLREAWVEVAGKRAELRAGVGRIAWGRLDEVQPSDVINPIDTARYFLDGRSDARLPIAFARGRWFMTSSVTLEGVAVPFFRRSTFDSLDEKTSPFNLINDAVLPAGTSVSGLDRRTPARTWKNMQGGGRLTATAGRVDFSTSIYRGFDGFGDVTFDVTSIPQPGAAVVGQLVERYRRFTMTAADFETVAGAWAFRGEAALFIQENGRDALEAGLGVDRKSGEYRLFASAVYRQQFAPQPVAGTAKKPAKDLSLIGSIERRFGREHYLARAFGVFNPADRSGFMRGLFAWSVSDHVAIEASAATFRGTGDDRISQFAGRDFLSARLRYFF